jgi:F0F1-type ATP synthase delta subunit
MSLQDIDSEFAVLKTIVSIVGLVNGYTAGTTAAFLVERKIRAALEKANIQGGEIACRTVVLLVRKGLFKYASALIDRIRAELDRKNGIVHLIVETVLPMDDASRKKILSAVTRQTGAKAARFTETIRPNLLGGYRLVFGNTVVDASLSAFLRDMGKKLMNK